jgi:hypothetical protein
VLQDEQGRGLALVNALDDARRGKAILKSSKTGDENLTEAWKDNVVLDYAGIRATDLSAGTTPAVGRFDWVVCRQHRSRARPREDGRGPGAPGRDVVAWIGRTEPGSVFYYRIHSPVILIEFDHQHPVGLRYLVKDRSVPTVEHIHTVVGTHARPDRARQRQGVRTSQTRGRSRRHAWRRADRLRPEQPLPV